MLSKLKFQNFIVKQRNFIRIITITFFYLIIFSWVLYQSNGIPYVMDNNETYSSLVHATSIEKFGVSHSKGLADEVFSPHVSAHPYVHSHQGNYPRLYSWVIYKLGATTPAQQIVVTTFTIGLAALLFAFAFF